MYIMAGKCLSSKDEAVEKKTYKRSRAENVCLPIEQLMIIASPGVGGE